MKKIIVLLMAFALSYAGFAQSIMLGDVNGNNQVDITDAMLIAQYTANMNPSVFNPAAADTDCSGTININDALLVARLSAGLISQFSCSLPTPTPTPTPQQNPVFTGGPYTLNGTSDSVELPNGLTSNLNDFSVACWVNLASVTNWVRIFDFGVDNNAFMMLTPQSGTTGYPYFAITTSGNSGEQGLNGTSALPTGSWQHLAVVKSGDTGILYINKQEVARNTSMTLRPADLGNTKNYIGKSQWPNDPLLNASISNFIIYSRALSAAEIVTLGNNVPTAIPTPTPTPTRTATPTATPTPTPTGNITTKIMPLGDSITDGIPTPGGYRIKLWSNIKNLGKAIDFVGSLSNGPTELTDKNHEGHSGWRIDQLDTNINGWMDTYKPKIVLLHIGTNDITQNYDLANAPNRVGGLIDKICAKLPSGGKIYVAKVIPISYASGDQAAVNFNNQLANVVQNRQSAGKPVYIVDMHSALTTSDLSDQVHPNRTGYDKMADVWFAAIKNDL